MSQLLDATLRELVADGTLTAAQAATVAQRLGTAAATADPAGRRPAARSGRLAEIAGYVGGALLLGAVSLFLLSGWADLDEPARVTLLVTLAVALLVSGGAVAWSSGEPVHRLRQRADSARRRLVSVLWTFAAIATSAAAGVAADDRQAVAAGAVGLVVAATTYAVMPAVVGQLAVWAASIALVSGLVGEMGPGPGATAYTWALFALGVGWVGLGFARVVGAREVALATGSALALVAAQLPVFDAEHVGTAYLLTAGAATAGYVGFVATRSWSLLAAGVVATALVVPEALHDWTDGSVSAAGLLLVAGLTVLSSGALGLRLRRQG